VKIKYIFKGEVIAIEKDQQFNCFWQYGANVYGCPEVGKFDIHS